ncbi:MAG: Unknown protein [uncultured Sulfurovum sp.]|uniref:Peptidase C14 caspase domain-containing protein n=1 Tax=uncultured Sulfurovum sp. TaxID=269237 RepID=A0A6S6U5R9_9BACT|nr:MAG: Unknown protein [uncultured Sulfurovum sp.]
MKKLLLALLILSSTLWAEKHALMVGVNDVKGEFHLNVNLDLEMMKVLLKKAGFEVHTLEGNKASLTEIRKKFKSFYSLGKNDTFLFYYTGHGARMRGVNENEPIDNFFVMHSTDFDNNLTIVNSGALTDNEYSMHLHNIIAQKVSIIDACHSATLYKSLSKSKFVKSILPQKGSETIFDRANNIENFQSFKPNNLINLSAAKDNQQAEISPKGSIFTLVLIDLIKKNPNMTFKTLEKKIIGLIKPTALRIAKQTGADVKGKFTPEIYTAPASLKNLRVKDIFVKKKKANPSLSSVLESKPSSKPQRTKQLSISTADNKTKYPEGKPIKFNITSTVKEGYLYLFEKKRNNYTLLGERKLQNCQNMGKEKYCKFDNIYASKPLGKSVAYVVVTKKALVINKKAIKKNFEITEEFFDVEENLATQIKKERVDQISLTLDII